jgi:hypothetical protein
MEDGPFPERTGQDTAGQDTAGQDTAGQDTAGQDTAGQDIVEHGGRGGGFFAPNWRPKWRVPKSAAVLAAVALLAGLAVGLAAGYHVGEQHAAASAAAPPTPSTGPEATAPQLVSPTAVNLAPATAFAFASAPALSQSIGACSVQQGKLLQLGVQVTNQSTVPLMLTGIKPVLPLGGLRPVSWQWGPCGAIPDGTISNGTGSNSTGPDIVLLGPGAGVWLSVTFKVLDRCPGPFPVQFTVGYTAGGKHFTAQLPGFPDLGSVPYAGCQAT